jgi:hypothetical protein
MRTNPYDEKVKRYGKIVAGIIGAVVSFGVDIIVLVTGRTSGLSGRSHVFTRIDSPSQFWFTIFLFALFGIAAAWYAWSSYRE